MEHRNLDLEIPLAREQWEQLGRRAAELGPGGAGYGWGEEEPERIHVYLRGEEARGIWSRFVSDEDTYGGSQLEVAQFVYNDGRPFAHLHPPTAAQPPAITTQEESAAQAGLEDWVHQKWALLLHESGLHYGRGHTR